VVKRREWSICEEEAERIKEDVVTRRKDHDREGYRRRTSKAASYRTNEDKRRDRTPKEGRERGDHPYRQGERDGDRSRIRSSIRKTGEQMREVRGRSRERRQKTPEATTSESSKSNPPELEETRRNSSTFFWYREVSMKKISQPFDIQVTTAVEPSIEKTKIEHSRSSSGIAVEDVVKIVQAATKAAGTEIREAIKICDEVLREGKCGSKCIPVPPLVTVETVLTKDYGSQSI